MDRELQKTTNYLRAHGYGIDTQDQPEWWIRQQCLSALLDLLLLNQHAGQKPAIPTTKAA